MIKCWIRGAASCPRRNVCGGLLTTYPAFHITTIFHSGFSFSSYYSYGWLLLVLILFVQQPLFSVVPQAVLDGASAEACLPRIQHFILQQYFIADFLFPRIIHTVGCCWSLSCSCNSLCSGKSEVHFILA